MIKCMSTSMNKCILAIGSAAMLLTGCQNPDGTQNNTGTGALIGGGIGAVGGAVTTPRPPPPPGYYQPQPGYYPAAPTYQPGYPPPGYYPPQGGYGY